MSALVAELSSLLIKTSVLSHAILCTGLQDHTASHIEPLRLCTGFECPAVDDQASYHLFVCGGGKQMVQRHTPCSHTLPVALCASLRAAWTLAKALRTCLCLL